jgi:hypothetical protein
MLCGMTRGLVLAAGGSWRRAQESHPASVPLLGFVLLNGTLLASTGVRSWSRGRGRGGS